MCVPLTARECLNPKGTIREVRDSRISEIKSDPEDCLEATEGDLSDMRRIGESSDALGEAERMVFNESCRDAEEEGPATFGGD